MLTEQFRTKALALLEQFQETGMTVTNQGKTLPYREFGELRMKAVPEIRSNLQLFLDKQLDLKTFKSNNEALTRKHDYWGMKGFSGQGFLNQISKFAQRPENAAEALRLAFALPKDKQDCARKIDELKTILPKAVERKGLPLASVPALLSYFWQIQSPGEMPIFYTSARQVLSENMFATSDSSGGQAFLEYWEINDQLFDLFSKGLNLTKANKYWFVEHVLWLEYQALVLVQKSTDRIKTASSIHDEDKPSISDFRSFIPPVLKDFEALASRTEGDSFEFEKAVTAAFKMLGFQVDGIGQGKGREPDAIARWMPTGFAVLIDAKSSSAGYSIGTGDRAIIEYIDKYDSKLRKEGIKRIYFVLVSSRFNGNSEKPLANIRKESSAKSVVLVTATQLLQILAKRIQEPFAFEVESIEELFFQGGILDDNSVRDFLASY
jgi:hypothetical protein